MRSGFQSKPAKVSSLQLKKESISTRSRLKLSKGKLQCVGNQEIRSNLNSTQVLRVNEGDEWIFSDEKLKAEHYGTPQNYQIKSRICIHRKDRNAKQNFIENHQNIKTPESNEFDAQCVNKAQKSQQKQKIQFPRSQQDRRPQITKQQDKQNEQQISRMSNELTLRYNLYSGLRRRRHINTSLQTYPVCNGILKPTAFSIELKKPKDFQENTNSPKRQKLYKITTTLSPKSKKGQIERNKSMQREFSFTSNTQNRKLQKIVSPQKQKFLLNGWEVQSPSFHDFDQLYRQRSNELQKMPLLKEANTFRKRIRIPAK